jgi:5'-3' exonuclease
MENKKILLVLDWSNLLFRSLFMNNLYNKASDYNRIEELRSFMYKFTTDVCSIINIFKPSNIIIATDA